VLVRYFWPRLGRVIFLLLGLGRVSNRWFGFGIGKFSLNIWNVFIFFLFGSKKISSGLNKGGSASYFLLTVGQRYAGSGHGPSLPPKSSFTIKYYISTGRNNFSFLNFWVDKHVSSKYEWFLLKKEKLLLTVEKTLVW